MSPSERLLEVRDLAKSFRHRPVLAGVTFSLEAGTVTGITGGNGAGKTTLLRCLAGLARYSGSVSLEGHPLSAAGIARTVAYLPQHTDLPEWATVDELLGLLARLRGAGPGTTVMPAEFLPAPEARIGTLSGGQRRRVALAGVLLGAPRLLLLDEPAASLDDAGAAMLWAVLRDRQSRGCAVLVASPSPGDFEGVAERLLVLSDGRLSDDRPGALPERRLLEESVA